MLVGMHRCIYVHVIHTMACRTTACNTADMCAAKKFAFTEEQGLLVNYACRSSQTVEGGLQSTVGGLCTVQCGKQAGEEEDEMLAEKQIVGAEDAQRTCDMERDACAVKSVCAGAHMLQGVSHCNQTCRCFVHRD